ncbi:MAG: hypothetical protein ACI9TH_001289 [Kiritimatiellia bacterium]|jgi:hypothetical protein
MKKTPMILPALLLCLLPAVHAAELAIEKADGQIKVTVDGKPFTTYDYTSYGKPILWPVIGPTGSEMTRNYPMKKGVANEAEDHPHHKSFTFHHGEVSGENFWHESDKGNGTIQNTAITQAELVDGKAIIASANDWVGQDGKTVILRDETRIVCHADAQNRYIDFEIKLITNQGDVTFQDTKEGTMMIRTHPALRLKGKAAKGKAVNSSGDKDGSLWGKKAAWVDYWAPVDGTMCGIAIFDHPENLRYPTTWHARDYGLIAANPFGLSYFEKGAGKGAGDYTIKKGESQTFKYRFVFHTGDHEAAKIPALFKAWAL